MTWHATSELVALAWLRGVPGLDPADVGDTLPEDNTTWSACGFTQLVAVVGGTPGMYVPERTPVVQVDFWATNPGSPLPPWGKARQLAEAVIADTYLPTAGLGTGGTRDVTALMPSGFRGAVVQSAYVVTEPRRLPGDAGAYARLTMDLALAWVELPES